MKTLFAAVADAVALLGVLGLVVLRAAIAGGPAAMVLALILFGLPAAVLVGFGG